jgi:regulator of replication initiation timing
MTKTARERAEAQEWGIQVQSLEVEIERLTTLCEALRSAQTIWMAENERLKKENERCRMFRMKLWNALRELADLVKDEA